MLLRKLTIMIFGRNHSSRGKVTVLICGLLYVVYKWKSSTISNELTETDVFDESIALQQDDMRLLSFIKENYLIPPSAQPYNLENPLDDPSKDEKQNQYALEILGHKRGGFFVESGAWDGEFLSTTLLLERDYGWTGLLIEPNGKGFEVLRSKNRKAWIANICLSAVNRPQMANFGEINHSGIHESFNFSGNQFDRRGLIVLSAKPCFPVFSILAALKITTVDFFTLDIEGTELDALKTIPFEKIIFKVFSIAWNHIPEGKNALKEFMESKNYILVKDLLAGTAADLVYVHESVPIPTEVLKRKGLL